MKLHIKEIADYIKCPQRHRFQYEQKVDYRAGLKGAPGAHQVMEYYDYSLHQVIYAMFNQFMDDKFPSPYYVKQRWGALWNKGRTKQDVLAYSPSWRDQVRTREKRGLKALLDLHSDFQNNPGTPILIGKEYVVQIGKHELVGTIEMVREITDETGKSIIEIVDFKTDDRYLKVHIKGDIEVTAASYAFRKLFGHVEDRITYHGILSRNQVYTKRDEKDYALLERVVDQVATAIEAGIHYPVLDSRCHECPFHKVCEKKEWFT